MIIRKYTQKDRSPVENIQFETYFLGKSGSLLVDDKQRLIKDIRYYLEDEPESCFVAEDKGKIVGYVLGCLNDKNHDADHLVFFLKHIIILFQLSFMSSKDRKFWKGKIKIIYRALLGKSDDMKFKVPENAGHLHINLLPQARGKGVGTKLLKVFFKYAKSQGVKTIHADSFQTKLNPNKTFWIKNGFKEYCKVSTSFWKEQYPDEKIYVVCYIRNL